MYSNFFPQKKSQARKVTLGAKLCCLGVTWVKWNYSRPLHYIKSWIFFASTVCWNFFIELLSFHKGTVTWGWSSKLGFLKGKRVENSSFAILMMSLLFLWFPFGCSINYLKWDLESSFLIMLLSLLTINLSVFASYVWRFCYWAHLHL